MDRSLHSLRMGTSQYDFASRWKRAEAVIEHAQKLVASKLFWGSTRDARCCPWLRGWFCCGLSDLLSAVANETLAVAAPFVALLHLISDSLCRKQPCAYVLIVCRFSVRVKRLTIFGQCLVTDGELTVVVGDAT